MVGAFSSNVANGVIQLVKVVQRIFKFGSVGVVTTAFGVTSYYILLDRLNGPLYPVCVTVWVLSVFVSYVLNTRFNYKRTFNIQDLAVFYRSYLSGLIFGLLIVFLLKTADFGLSDFAITVVSIIPRFLLVFAVIELFGYKN